MKKKRFKNRQMKKGFIVFVYCILIVYFIGFLGSLFTSSNVQGDWYKSVRPAITPPNYVFPIVWNILFFLIALSLAIVWNNAGNLKEKKLISWIFGVNLILNLLWSVFYFGLHNPFLAFIDIAFLLISILVMIWVSMKISKKAGWLLVPYFIWVSFASALNFLSI
jgi:tryptophan-rich sensory protein